MGKTWRRTQNFMFDGLNNEQEMASDTESMIEFPSAATIRRIEEFESASEMEPTDFPSDMLLDIE